MLVSQNRDTPHLPAVDNYAALHGGFKWLVPEKFNIAQVCCARWANTPETSQRVAIREYCGGTDDIFHTYAELQQQANRLSNVLTDLGVGRGERVAIVMPQCFETAVAYMAVLQMGAVAMPLSMLFGSDALEFRLHDSEAVLAICDASALDKVQAVRTHCPLLRCVIGVGELEITQSHCDLNYGIALAQHSPHFVPVVTQANEPAVLIYTSGTTGNPKGALIAQRALIGNLTGFVCSQNWFGFDGRNNQSSNAVFWSPADWAWTGGLMDALLPTLYFGRPIVAYQGRFGAQTALELMSRCGVTHTFLFPTALKAMMKACPGQAGRSVRQQFKLQLQAIMSAGEAVGDAVFDYCQQQLGISVNEMFGQTEINYIVGNCSMNFQANAAAQGRPKLVALSLRDLPEGTAPSGGSATPALSAGADSGEVASVGALVGWPPKPGSMGKGYPGHRVRVIDDDGVECPVGVAGDVALNRFDVHGAPDPIFFLGYWKNEAATGAKFTGDWCRTGDLATRDADGYLWYQGRADDMFKAAGYRIGPGEIENCLVKHPAVANAAVVPKPDPERGALVKAYVVLSPDFLETRAAWSGDKARFDARLVIELQDHVKGKLAPYEYPKEIEFIDALPMTTTGKVQRRVLRLQEQERFSASAQGRVSPDA